MSERFFVELGKEDHVFAAAHFITFNKNICERIHGHNYRVRVTVEGPLDENAYVVDFIALRDGLKKILVELDHHVLLPTQHPMIHVAQENGEIVARFEGRRWVFPIDDCVLMDIQQTTAELLAKWIGERLLAQWQAEMNWQPASLVVKVDENHEQWGVWEKRLG